MLATAPMIIDIPNGAHSASLPIRSAKMIAPSPGIMVPRGGLSLANHQIGGQTSQRRSNWQSASEHTGSHSSDISRTPDAQLCLGERGNHVTSEAIKRGSVARLHPGEGGRMVRERCQIGVSV